MNIVIFTGPSLSQTLVAETLEADCRPPVSQGDVYRAALESPDVIGIIDGYFRSVPSVWHKEILWALSKGIKVYGCSSMGALRAAELAPFGMIGVGWVYDAFRTGELTDDDEVAVEHGPAELDYACTSEAMVNIRRTLAVAHSEKIILSDTRLMLEATAKSLFYPMRTYANMLSAVNIRNADQTQIDALAAWLPAGQINQKRNDAIEMLREIRATACMEAVNRPIDFKFEHTEMWDEVLHSTSDR
jgi:hypothetical protein